MTGSTERFRVHAIQRNRNLRDVVEEIVKQDLHRQHGQERKEQGGTSHAKHVAKVRAGAHHDVFEDIAECASSFQHRVVQHSEVVFEQNEIGCLFGDVNGA